MDKDVVDLGEDDEDLANNPAVRVMNALSRCLQVAASVASVALTPGEHRPLVDTTLAAMLSEPFWARYCESIPIGERKKSMLGVIAEYVSLAPLIELPNVQGPKQMLRETMARAKDLERAIAGWDDATEPTSEMMSVAIAVCDIVWSAPPDDAP